MRYAHVFANVGSREGSTQPTANPAANPTRALMARAPLTAKCAKRIIGATASILGGSTMNVQQNSKKPQVAIMNAVHDLPVLVARDKGFFKDEGLDIEFVTTPGMAQVTTSHSVKADSVFDRPLDSVYNEGGIDQYRMCEWGIMKRAVEASCQGLRHRKIVALGASMSMFAVVVARDSNYYEPEMLKDKEIAVTPNNGSDF